MKTGEEVWYISIPNDNDWANARARSGKYKIGCFDNEIYSTDEAAIERKCSEIRNLFADPSKYVQATGDVFHRIYVQHPSWLRTIKHKRSLPSEKKYDQYMNYKNNCFENESDAETVMIKICEICGIK